MAQAGYTPIQLYLSTTASAVPSAGNLANGELAINITDGKLFYKDNGGVVQVLATKGAGTIGGSNTQVQYNSSGALAGSANLTFDGTTLTAAGLAGPHNGTVGATTPNTGAFTTLSASSTVSGAGFSTYLASPPAIGGTSANAGAFTTLAASGTVTFSGGTANGVAYLNGSKVLTSGGTLTFDGTTLTSSAFSGSGAALTSLNASNLASGTVATARLASGIASSSTYLRGDQTWASIPSGTPGGSNTQVQYNNSGSFGGSANLTFDGTTLTASNTISAPNTFGFKNRIINGAMVIDQRNAGASVAVNNNAFIYSVDRWAGLGQPTDGVFTLQRSTTAPAGFTNSLLATVTTADTSVGATQFYTVRQAIEGSNIADLGWGASGAQTVTLSFWVRSSLTGTFGGSLRNAAANRSYPFTYTISAANTFEFKTITVAGDTTGTWATDNTEGINVFFGLGVGSTLSGAAGSWSGSNFLSATGATSVVGTNGATLYITGVQLEKGSTATPFDYRPYGTELALCQRYYEASTTAGSGLLLFSGNVSNGANYYHSNKFSVAKRANPTFTFTDTGSLSFPAGAPALNATTTTEFSTTKTATATNVGYFQYSFAASAEL